MGIHVCNYCPPGGNPQNWYNHTSSGDVTLAFKSGHIWEMPDMLPHYMRDHNYHPPIELIEDLIFSELDLSDSFRLQTKGPQPQPIKVGYLEGSFETGEVSIAVIALLEYYMNKAQRNGDRRQTRSFTQQEPFVGTPK